MLTIWLLVCVFGFLLGLFSLKYSYYRPLVTKSWILRYRKINNIDHVGFILETAALAVGLVILFIVAYYIFPEQSQLFLKAYWRTGWIVAIMLTAIAIILVNNITLGPPSVMKILEKDFPALDHIKNNEYKTELQKIRIQYIVYSISSLILVFSFLLSTIFVISGEIENFRGLSSIKKQLLALEYPNIIENVDLGLIQKSYYLVYEYSRYQNELYRIASQTLGFFSLILFAFIFYLGTSWQKLQSPSSLLIIKILSNLFIFILVPIVLFSFYFGLVSTSNSVSLQLNKPILAAFGAEDGVDKHELRAKIDDLKEFQQIGINFRDNYSVGKYWIYLGSTWGGILLLIQVILNIIQKKYGILSFFSNLFPKEKRYSIIWRALFIPVKKINKNMPNE